MELENKDLHEKNIRFESELNELKNEVMSVQVKEFAETAKKFSDIEIQQFVDNCKKGMYSSLKEAQKEIKIFQDLVAVEKQKNQGKKVGAPPISVRENVIELNHKGWSEEQIANALNITLSEVQLLLDYYGKEGR